MCISAAGSRPPRREQRSAARASISLAQTSVGGALLRLLKEFVHVAPGFGRELLRQRWEFTAAVVYLNPLDPVHGKEDNVRRGGFTGFPRRREILQILQ